MQSFVTTSCVGGRHGKIFQDVFIRGADGKVVIEDFDKCQLNLEHSIKRIAVSSGWVVDGITVTYDLGGGTSNDGTLVHGSQFNNAAVVNFCPTEILAAVFGRAGMQSFYNRELINSIGFFIFDTATGSTRTAGPFGNSNGANEGKPFICSDVVAFGGFTESTLNRLSGLFFYKDVGKH